MFKKKPTIKTLSPLRSSDRRKIAEQIISDYGLSAREAQPTEDKDAQAAATAAHSQLRNQILPESSLSAKFTTTSGPDLKEVHGMVYVGNHEDDKEQRVLWVRVYDRLYPSVYTLWHNPGILPLIHTPSIVVDKLKGGADLMTPGLIGPPFPTKATKGAIVAVASSNCPSVPVVVGTCAIDISKLEKVQGSKGHAVEIFHWAGDDLWDWSTSGKSGVPPPQSLEGWLQETHTLEEGIEQLDMNERDGGVSIISTGAAAVAGSSENSAEDASSSRRNDLDAEEESDMTQQDIDRAFHQAFLYGIHSYMQANPGTSNYGLTFPLSQSFVLQNLVHPFLPTFTQKQIAALVIKKTSWKNGRKFIKYLDKQKLILSKDRSNNEVDILDVDFDDPVIKGFQPYSLPTKSSNTSGAPGKSGAVANGGDESLGQKLKKVDLYRPTDKLSPLFQSASKGPKALYAATDLRQSLTSYIETNNLVNAQNKRLVTLDPILANAVFSPSNRLDAEVLSQGTVPRDALVDRVLQQCQQFHAILRNDETLESATAGKPKAGGAPRLGIVMETRGGNKTATRVHGLEPYFVNPQMLADELRKTCASSTSIEPYKAGGKGMMEVMVQGPQRDAVLKALEKRGVQKAWVDVTDKTKGKKK